jgi:hypothetical protein
MGIRLLQISPINAKNNTQQVDKNMINFEMIIKCKKLITNTEILSIKKKLSNSQ